MVDARALHDPAVIGKPPAHSAHRPRPVWFGTTDAPLFGLVSSPDIKARAESFSVHHSAVST